MHIVGCDQPHVAVNSAVKIKISRQRRDVGVETVINFNGNQIRLVIFYIISYIERKSRVAADVFADEFVVDVNVCDLICTFKEKKNSLIFQVSI